jgi:hypothetical protein
LIDVFQSSGYRSLGSSQRGSWGNSYSETPDSIGEPLDERREGRTNITPEWREELESTDTCNTEACRYSLIVEPGKEQQRQTDRRISSVWTENYYVNPSKCYLNKSDDTKCNN